MGELLLLLLALSLYVGWLAFKVWLFDKIEDYFDERWRHRPNVVNWAIFVIFFILLDMAVIAAILLRGR